MITSGVIWLSALLFVVLGVVEFRAQIQQHAEEVSKNPEYAVSIRYIYISQVGKLCKQIN